METRSNDCENGNACSSSAVKLSDCIEELVKFTLFSHSHLNLLNLSTQFCSTLLKDDPEPPPSSHSHPQDSLQGVPPYPLYKRLASALLRCMDSGTFWSPGYNVAMAHELENCSLQQKHNEWHKLIAEKGFEIVNVLKSVRLELHIQEPFFTHLKDGLKTIEGRCARGKHNRIEVGNLILFNKSLVFEVQEVRRYASFFDMLEAENLEKVLPGVESVEEGVKVYRRFFTEEKERENGVLAIIFSKTALQPYISLASLFSGLKYEGVQGLLGIIHTTGTVPNALPPPRSSLLASFNLPCNPNFGSPFETLEFEITISKAHSPNGMHLLSCVNVLSHSPNGNPNKTLEIALSTGARALAKHACRSSSGYWGSLDGNDSNKNRLAMNVINHLITHCCWLNIHIVPPHGVVFEIRVAEGYGARWTEDGSKFIGFLEPYMQDGHSKGWKH